jgi:hypothetical protein
MIAGLFLLKAKADVNCKLYTVHCKLFTERITDHGSRITLFF